MEDVEIGPCSKFADNRCTFGALFLIRIETPFVNKRVMTHYAAALRLCLITYYYDPCNYYMVSKYCQFSHQIGTICVIIYPKLP